MHWKHTKQEFLRTEALQNAVVQRELIGLCHYCVLQHEDTLLEWVVRDKEVFLHMQRIMILWP